MVRPLSLSEIATDPESSHSITVAKSARETVEPPHRLWIPVGRHCQPVLSVANIYPGRIEIDLRKTIHLCALAFRCSIEASSMEVDGLGPGAIGLVDSPTGSSCCQPPPHHESPAHRNHADLRARSCKQRSVIACRAVGLFSTLSGSSFCHYERRSRRAPLTSATRSE